MDKLHHGFTLIELMIVVALIGILSTMAIPTYQEYIIRGQIAEAMNLSDGVQKSIAEYYKEYQRFPADNQTAGAPEPKHMISNFVTGVHVMDGAIHVTLGNRVNALAAGKILSLRPAYVNGSPATPISWLCGYAEAVDGMTAQGDNKTSVPAVYLSPGCRTWKTSRE
ncbi:MAG: pilin [Gammaproteobacteria bacterium]|nr:pilin [Gammaproteobacteria bacterium]